MSGKGSNRRHRNVDKQKFDDNWDRIYAARPRWHWLAQIFIATIVIVSAIFIFEEVRGYEEAPAYVPSYKYDTSPKKETE